MARANPSTGRKTAEGKAAAGTEARRHRLTSRDLVLAGDRMMELGTPTQSTVARLESGQRLPALRSLQRYADAIGHRLQLRLTPARK